MSIGVIMSIGMSIDEYWDEYWCQTLICDYKLMVDGVIKEKWLGLGN